ncbi:DUF4157 domain-containing protein [Desulfurivibrio sp. D14AmB]|uniref:eCIS core domain-containing protein n=1 Tax=Desulfurivibrio sp. D14AmB TaxID=3374370 RepID=UPI00376EC7A5
MQLSAYRQPTGRSGSHKHSSAHREHVLIKRHVDDGPTHAPLYLQRSLLNAIAGFSFIPANHPTGYCQPKLTIGNPYDAYEQEADQVANAIMRLPDKTIPAAGQELEEPFYDARIQTSPITTGAIQRLCPHCVEEREDEGEEETVQRKAGNEPAIASGQRLAHYLRSGNDGKPVPGQVRDKAEAVLGRDLSRVRVHQNQAAQDAARQINARAFTHSNHIYLGRGQSANDTKLMAHELTHVVQQTGGDRRGGNAARVSPVSPRIARWRLDVPAGVATSDRNSDTLWGLARLLTGQGSWWPLVTPINMQSPRAGHPEFWRYIWIGDTFSISGLTMLVGSLPWNPNTIVTFLARRGDQDTIQSLLAAGYGIYRFTTTMVTWRDNATGVETEEDETGSLGGTCETGREMGCVGAREILIRTGLPTDEAASTLFHERGHVISGEPDYLEQEIQVRIDEENFRIRHNMPEAEPGYRNPDGTVNEAAIRLSVTGSDFYNPTTRTMVALRDTGRRRTLGWARLLRLICP